MTAPDTRRHLPGCILDPDHGAGCVRQQWAADDPAAPWNRDAGLREAVDRASAVFGWQHLARYSGMSAEWLDATLTALVRAARVIPPGSDPR